MAKSVCPNCGNSYRAGEKLCTYCGLLFPFPTDTSASGDLLQNRYEIVNLIHSGGMGYVYIATDTVLHRQCVVKQIKQQVRSEEHQAKLSEEAFRMAALNHPNVVVIFDHFVENGYYFLVVENVAGKNLHEIYSLRRGELDESELIPWFISICNAIGYIHKKGIVHRDISPDNIMLTEEGFIKLVDFGTLRELRIIAEGKAPREGKFGFTPPEQWEGHPVPQSDVFAIGATIYYMLTGFLPISKELQSGGEPQPSDYSPAFPPLCEKNVGASKELEAALQKCLQININKRYASVQELEDELTKIFQLSPVDQVTGKRATGKPVLKIDSESIDFGYVVQGDLSTKNLIIRNAGTGMLRGEITPNNEWINIDPFRIDLRGAEQSITVRVDSSQLPSKFSGTGSIMVTTNGGAASITIKVSTGPKLRGPAPTIPLAGTHKQKRLKAPAIAGIAAGIVVLGLLALVLTGVIKLPIPGMPQQATTDNTYSEDMAKLVRAEHNNKGEQLLTNGKYDEAIAEFNAAIGADPKFALAYYNRGLAYGDKTDWDMAVADFTKAIELDPKLVNAYISRSWAYYGKGDWDNVITDASKVIELDPGNSTAYNNRSAAYKEKKDWDEAIGDATKAIELDPKWVYPYINRSWAYSGKGDWDRALTDASKVIELDPKSADYYVNRSWVYSEQGDWDRVIGDATKAIELDSVNSTAYGNRSWAYSGKGDWDRALADANKALELDPKHADAYAARSWAYSGKGDWDTALADANKAVELDPKHADAYAARSRVYNGKRDWDTALADANKAVELEPYNLLAFYTQGLAYKGLGKKAEAIAAFEKFLSLSKDTSLIEKTKQNLSELRQ